MIGSIHHLYNTTISTSGIQFVLFAVFVTLIVGVLVSLHREK